MPFDPDAYLASAPTFDPDAYLSGLEPKTGVVQGTKVAARAAAPYATVAGMGALMGAPFGGPAGAMTGAALGVGALGAADLLTGAYNVAAPYLGAPTFTQPSTAIEQLYGRVGVGAEPETPEQRMLAAGVRGAAAGYGQAQALNRLAPYFANPAVQNAMRSLGATPFAQGGAGFGAGAGAQAAQELGFETGGQLAGSLIGGMVGGKMAQGGVRTKQRFERQKVVERTPETQQLYQTAANDYAAMDNANVVYSPEAYEQMVNRIKSGLEKTRYTPRFSPQAKDFLDELDDRLKTPQGLTDLDVLRAEARDRMAKASAGEKKALSVIYNEIDDALDNLSVNNLVPKDPSTHVVTPTVAKTLAEKIQSARDKFRIAKKSETIEDLIFKAEGSTVDDPIRALRTQFSTLAKNKKELTRFTDDEQRVIKQIAAGEVGPDTLRALESLSPGFSRTNLFGNLVTFVTGSLGASVAGPVGYGLAYVPGKMGQMAREARGAEAIPFANQFAAAVRAGAVQDPYTLTYRNMMLPVGQEFLRSQQP